MKGSCVTQRLLVKLYIQLGRLCSTLWEVAERGRLRGCIAGRSRRSFPLTQLRLGSLVLDKAPNPSPTRGEGKLSRCSNVLPSPPEGEGCADLARAASVSLSLGRAPRGP